MSPETVLVESSILDRLVLPPESARAVLSIKFTAEDEERMRELLDRNNQGTITARELAEMEGYRRVGTFLGVMQAKARLQLKQVGTRA
jgi:hypothetical protein